MPTRHTDFAATNRVALKSCPELLHEWFPNGRVAGREFLIGNVQGDPGRSLRINLDTGLWSDFATKESGRDLVALFAAVRGLDQGVAAAELAKKLNIEPTSGTEMAGSYLSSRWQPIVPAPSQPQHIHHPKSGPPDATWPYQTADGGLLFIVCRWNLPDGKKRILPYSYGVLGKREGWHFKHLIAPRPLYGLEELAAKPNATVLIVEGEMSADAARRLVPEYACVTWPGGSSAVAKIDLSPLKVRRVLIWPDNDRPGRKAAQELRNRLEKICAEAAHFVEPPSNKPEGWDLANAEAEG